MTRMSSVKLWVPISGWRKGEPGDPHLKPHILFLHRIQPPIGQRCNQQAEREEEKNEPRRLKPHPKDRPHRDEGRSLKCDS